MTSLISKCLRLPELNITHTCDMLPCNNKAMNNEFVGFARLQHPALPVEARALLVPPVLLGSEERCTHVYCDLGRARITT